MDGEKVEQKVHQKETFKRIKKRARRELGVAIIVTVGIFLVIKYLLPLLFPFVLAYGLARALLPIVKWMHNKVRLPMMLCTAITILFCFLVLGVALFFIGRMLLEQILQLLKNIPIYQQVITNGLLNVFSFCDDCFGLKKGSVNQILSDNMNSLWGTIQDIVMPFMTEKTVMLFVGLVGIISILFIFFMAVYSIILDYEGIRENFLQSNVYQLIHPVTSKLGGVGYAYLKTQAIIMGINGVVLVIGLWIIKNPYALLIGITIAILDAFPVIGSGLFLVPMAIINLLYHNVMAAAVLMSLYGLCELIRTLVEPRILGNKIGVRPIFTIMAMFLGVKLFGVMGFLYGPFGLVIIKIIVKEWLQQTKEYS